MNRTPDPKPVHDAAHRRDWPAYFDRIEGNPPRETLVHALDLFDAEDPAESRTAADIGCGSGRDTQCLLERGWRVWAQDGSIDGLERARARPEIAGAVADGRAELVHADYSDIEIPPVDLVNASFSLPFCPPDAFRELWRGIDAAIPVGGRFSGQFFGDRDSWAMIEDRTHLTRAETLALFDQYILEHLKEEDRPSAADTEPHKHWHVFHIVALKRA